jgi:hypothetical protein
MNLDSESFRIAGLAVINIPVYLLIGRVFFGSFDGFLDAVKDTLIGRFLFSTCDPSGRSFDYMMATVKIMAFVALCVILVAAEYQAAFGGNGREFVRRQLGL